MNGTNTLQPATLEDCNLVLAQFQDLTAAGFDRYYKAQHERKNARRAHEGLPPEVCHPTPITDPGVRGEISSARQFIRKVGRRRKTINRKLGTSYGLKHEAERYMGVYISNGAFIAAAHLEGYAIKREGPNACVSLSFTPEYCRLLSKGLRSKVLVYTLALSGR
jgi:hypothetical protein